MGTKNQKPLYILESWDSGVRVKGRLTKKSCSDSECDHGREMYRNVNFSLNIMFITLTIHHSPIMREMNERDVRKCRGLLCRDTCGL